MKKKLPQFALRHLALLVTLLASCTTDSIDDIKPEDEATAMEELIIPNNFHYETSKSISVNIIDETTAQYIISDEFGTLGTLLSTTKNSAMQFVVASSVEVLHLKRTSSRGKVSQKTVEIHGEIAFYEHHKDSSESNQGSGRIASCSERLYAVNNQGGFYEIDNESGAYEATNLANLQGGGSIACALDQENNLVYYNVNTTMYSYHVETESFKTVFSGNPFNRSYPRLALKDGNFYMSDNVGNMYVVNASTNQVVQYYKISGFVNNQSGGDLAFASDGQLYLACFSGLYKFISFDDENEKATITRLSAENFPFQLTSMAIDRNDDIYVATNDNRSKLLRMTIQDGSYEEVAQYNHKINDLTAWRCSADDLSSDDADGDGIIDLIDAFPDDASKAAETFTPSELGWGSIGFEDLWPNKGDYDFNDLIINYRFTNIANAQNEIVEMHARFKVSALDASYKNGFGLELPFDESWIRSVTGPELTEGLINVNSKGLEEGQEQPVIIVFDNAFMHGNNGECAPQPNKDIALVIEFASPISPSVLGSAPFNPFIFVNGERGREIHLSDRRPTSKANLAYFKTGADNSALIDGNYYKTQGNLPWAIHVIHNFRATRSGRAINLGYNKFNNWATAGGGKFRDWYKDNSGYRTTKHLCID